MHSRVVCECAVQHHAHVNLSTFLYLLPSLHFLLFLSTCPSPQLLPTLLHSTSHSPCTRMITECHTTGVTYQVWVWVDLWVHWRALGWAVESSSTVGRTASLAPDSKTILCCSCHYGNKSNLVPILHRKNSVLQYDHKVGDILQRLTDPHSHIRTGLHPGTCVTSRRRRLHPSHYSGWRYRRTACCKGRIGL